MKNTPHFEYLGFGRGFMNCSNKSCNQKMLIHVPFEFYEIHTVICSICSSELKYHRVPDFADGDGSSIKNTEFSKNMVGFFEAMIEAAEELK